MPNGAGDTADVVVVGGGTVGGGVLRSSRSQAPAR